MDISLFDGQAAHPRVENIVRFFGAFVLATYLWAAFASSVLAQNDARYDPVALEPRVLADAFQGKVWALRDATGTLTFDQARSRFAQGGFAQVVSKVPDFGFASEPIWLYVPITNPTQQTDWRLRLRENFFQEFSAWHVRDGVAATQLEMQDETTGFDTRQVQWSELVVAFEQETGTDGALWIRYRSGGSTEVEMSLFDAPTFDIWTDRKTARNFIYYGMLIFLIVAAFATWTATHQNIFLAYAAYAIAGLLFVMHGDGNTFRYLWPGAPGFNAFASIPLGTGIVVFGANFARAFLQTSIYHPVFDRLLLGTIWVGVLTAASSAFLDTQMIKKVLVLMAFGSTLLFTASGLNAARTRFREVRFYVLAWFGAVISAGIMTSRHWLGLEISEEVQYDSMRIVLVLDAALMGLAILDRFNNLRRSRSDALETSLATAERNLSLSQRLQTLEQRYAWASDLARNREQRVADAMHDLRQPLHALRLNVQGLMSGAPGDDQRGKDIEKTFGFLEELVTQELEGHVQDADPQEPPTQGVALSEILEAAGKMFRADAQAKGIALEIVKTDAQLHIPAIDAMRILTNLVSNAVRYTPQGRVVVSVTGRDDAGLQIEVHDTGPGMTEAEFNAALPRAARLPQTATQPGSGLGLAIVAQTCTAHGLGFERLPSQLSGTSLAVIFGPEHLI